jgi:hypothetical protein
MPLHSHELLIKYDIGGKQHTPCKIEAEKVCPILRKNIEEQRLFLIVKDWSLD